MIGYNLPIALIVWGIYYAAVARKRGVIIGGLSFLSIFICMIASGLIRYSQQEREVKRETKQVLLEIQENYTKMIESTSNSQGLLERKDKPSNTSNSVRGELEEMKRFITDFMDQIVSYRNDYFLELDAIGLNKIMDTDRIKTDSALIESKIIIRKSKEIVSKYQNKTNVLLNVARENIRSLNISKSLKNEMLLGFEQGMEKAQDQIYEMWALEEKVLKEYENVINYLSARKNAWVVKEGQILFYNYDDLKRFNAYIASIQNILNKQQQIQKKSVETVNRNFNSLIEEMK
jgi:hypothetical protein